MFGLVIAGRPVTDPSALRSFSPNEHAFIVPDHPPFSHIVVFIAPGTAVPPDAAVGVFIKFPKQAGLAEEPAFQLLGGLSAEKQSAMFRVSGLRDKGSTSQGAVVGFVNRTAEVDMDADEPSADAGPGTVPSTGGDIVVGLQIQPAAQLVPQLAALDKGPTGPALATGASNAGVMTRYQPPHAALPPNVLAQRIIKNAFNYLASFARGRAGEEVVPLRSFEQWWRKTESRFDSDPGFLEREVEGG